MRRFTSLSVLWVVLLLLLHINIIIVLAVPAPDKYIHFKDPGCRSVRSTSCLYVPYCKNHRKLGDLFTSRGGNLKSRGGPPELEEEKKKLALNGTADDALSPSRMPTMFLTTREFDDGDDDETIRKRVWSSTCGVLACYTNREVSARITSLVPGVLYDLIIDYPYDGATGGTIGVFAQVTVAGVISLVRVGQAHTGYGGPLFSFTASRDAGWYQIIFIGETVGFGGQKSG